MSHAFSQVDVFSAAPLLGNPVAVVHGADDLTDEQMAAFARWTNLSETTFLLSPTDPAADYRLRIFTPGGELPFAGHPTLGSAHAWLEAGGTPRTPGVVVQECGVGLVDLRRHDGRLAFAAPKLLRSGPADAATTARVTEALGLSADDVVAVAWVDNGPGWVAALVRDAETVLAAQPDLTVMRGLEVGLVGPYPPGSECAVEVRAFVPGLGVDEDPVTGSLNAGIAQWLIGSGRLPESYVASQGTVLRRQGRVHIARLDGVVWVGGDTTTTIRGQLEIG
ncbi:PhzF family phenazine biosynthesis protein [Nocardioides sp. Y6]|uniref:PhzF family phenazine biosynthesis protein n=1 Tax=Nocardioides malaquae TaxID=2773426 RepID=A0ABR9RVT1_9ACTN|nr:PhzF family phenazine biosynthesis protein [Nocardioides malaquae]MBE7325662.1 PhzF family phenazine biosynthesis protein [Nocardioides malaquae]